MYDAVIFDLDGTLIDSESITQAAGIEAFAAMGIDIDPAFLHALIGVDDRTGSGVIRARFPQLDTDLFSRTWSDALRRRWDDGVPLKAGTQEVLSRIILPKALATSSTRLQADRKLMLTGLGVQPSRWTMSWRQSPPLTPIFWPHACWVSIRRAALPLKTARRGQDRPMPQA